MKLIVTKRPFGRTAAGEAVTAFVMKNDSGMEVTVLDYGATIQSIRVFGVEVVLGYDTISGYEQGSAFLGATIGRTCNRIAGASIQLGGKTYELARNDGRNQHHGGACGFDRRMWEVTESECGLVCARLSPDGEEGYPGNLRAAVTFLLTEENTLRIRYDADTDADTLVNMTNHSYFNLNGAGLALDHIISAPASRFVENNAESIPTGRILPVDGTPFDFRQPKPLGQDIETPCQQLRQAKGYDHTLVCSEAEAYAPQTGIRLQVKTDLPGIHLYSANYTNDVGRGGTVYSPRSAVCFETQFFADAIHHYGFPSPVLHCGEHMHAETEYHFSKESK